MSHGYIAFGLTFLSDVVLDELTEISVDRGARYDVEIVLTDMGRAPPKLGEGPVFELYQNGEHYLAWPGVAAFRIRGLSRIEVEPHPDAPPAYLAFPLLGPVIGFLLHLRGLLVLHASAVEIEGSSAIFVGDKLAGKSTTAAAFLKLGHRLLTDDLLAFDLSDVATPKVLPALAQLKLSEEVSGAISLPNAEKLPLVFEGFSKHQHRLLGTFSHKSVPAGHIYVLDRSDAHDSDLAIRPLNGVAALQAVTRFAYAPRFGAKAFPEGTQASHLQRCANVANKCKIARLEIPPDLDRLDDIVALVRQEYEIQ